MPDTPYLKIDGESVSLSDAVRILKYVGGHREFLSSVLEFMCVGRTARREGIRVADADLQTASDDERRVYGLYAAADTHAWLEEAGLSVEDWERALEYRLLKSRLAEKLVTDLAVEAQFQSQSDFYTVAAISVICVEARSKAVELADRLQGEEATFAELARRYSVNETSRDAGGLLGWVSLESLPAPLRKPISSSAGGGEVVGPVEAEGLWYLVRVEAVKAPELTDEIREEIRGVLLGEWVDEEKKRSRIDTLFR